MLFCARLLCGVTRNYLSALEACPSPSQEPFLLKQTENVHTDLSDTRAARVVISAKGAKMSSNGTTVN